MLERMKGTSTQSMVKHKSQAQPETTNLNGMMPSSKPKTSLEDLEMQVKMIAE